MDEVLARLSPELFRPRVYPEPSSQPQGTILRQPASQLIKDRLCYLDIVVSDGSLTRVPRLIGATVDQAAQRLAAADLRIASREQASGERAGRVFEQKPGAGVEVPRQSTVVAIIATPTERVDPATAAAAAVAEALAGAVRNRPERTPDTERPAETCLPLPDLAGQNFDDVLPALGRRYFRPRLSQEPSSEPRGTILRQPTTVPIDGSLCYLDVAISDGSLTRVPELEGATGEEAERRVAAADLRIAIREVPSSEPASRVFDQRPRAGVEVPRQSTVVAIVAVPQLFDVPAVIGLPYLEAARKLDRFTVTRAIVASRLRSGQVIDQDPRPPARRPAGAEVRLEVSDGSLVLVPPVERRTLQSAQAELAPLDLTAEIEEQEGDLEPGSVATQDPAAGTEVSRGSRVRLVVSTGLTVPDVVGRQATDAETLLARFEVEQSAVASTEPQGQVIDQVPRAPARAAAGSRVRLVVSDGSQARQPNVGGGPTMPAAHDGYTWPRWLTYLTVLLAGAGVFHVVRLRLRPPPPEPQVSARVESDLDAVEVTDAGLVGPEIHLSARLDAGDCEIRLEGDST